MILSRLRLPLTLLLFLHPSGRFPSVCAIPRHLGLTFNYSSSSESGKMIINYLEMLSRANLCPGERICTLSLFPFVRFIFLIFHLSRLAACFCSSPIFFHCRFRMATVTCKTESLLASRSPFFPPPSASVLTAIFFLLQSYVRSSASEHDISSTSAIDLPCSRTSRISSLYRFP